MLKKIIILIGISALSACATTSSQNDLPNETPSVQAASETVAAQAASEPVAPKIADNPPPPPLPENDVAPLPYPRIDPQSQIDDLTIKINKLEHKIEQLNTRIQQLERRPNVANPTPPKRQTPRKAKAQTVQFSPPPKPDIAPDSSEPDPVVNALAAAQQAFTKKQFQAAITHLRSADSGGDGSPTAQDEMFLLLQSHFKLNHCQSVIQIGRQFVSRFAENPNAPNALFAVGQCQWHIQQRDIAKDTWRDLMRRYPRSPIAKSAENAIKQK